MRIIFFLVFFIISSISFANLPFYPIKFPQDEAAHYNDARYPTTHMTEWWYYSGRLVSSEGRSFWFYLTPIDLSFKILPYRDPFFHVPAGDMRIVDLDNKLVYSTRHSYFMTPQFTHFSTKELDINLNNQFSAKRIPNTNPAIYSIFGESNDGKQKILLMMQQNPEVPYMLVSKKGTYHPTYNTTAYYYSMTHLLVLKGEVTINNNHYTIVPNYDNIESRVWYSHMWGDFYYGSKEEGGVCNYVWLAIRMKNGLDISTSCNLDFKTKKTSNCKANIILPKDKDHRYHTKNASITVDPNFSSDGYPTKFYVKIPDYQINLTNTAYIPHQDANNYWEGYSEVNGTFKGEPITGYSTTEMFKTIIK